VDGSTLDAGGADASTNDGGPVAPVDFKIIFHSRETGDVTVWRSKTGDTTDLGVPATSQLFCTYDGRFFAHVRGTQNGALTEVFDAKGTFVRAHPVNGQVLRPDGAALIARDASGCYETIFADGSSTPILCNPNGNAEAYTPDGASILWGAWSDREWLVMTDANGGQPRTIEVAPNLDAGPPFDGFISAALSFDATRAVGSTTFLGAYLSFPGNIDVIRLDSLTKSSVLATPSLPISGHDPLS
jgi:hypothetical protein